MDEVLVLFKNKDKIPKLFIEKYKDNLVFKEGYIPVWDILQDENSKFHLAEWFSMIEFCQLELNGEKYGLEYDVDTLYAVPLSWNVKTWMDWVEKVLLDKGLTRN